VSVPDVDVTQVQECDLQGSPIHSGVHVHCHIIVDPSDGPLADPLRRPFFRGTFGPLRRPSLRVNPVATQGGVPRRGRRGLGASGTLPPNRPGGWGLQRVSQIAARTPGELDEGDDGRADVGKRAGRVVSAEAQVRAICLTSAARSAWRNHGYRESCEISARQAPSQGRFSDWQNWARTCTRRWLAVRSRPSRRASEVGSPPTSRARCRL
jgi:hypothetical protein